MLELYYQGKGAQMNATPIPGFIDGGLDEVRELNVKKVYFSEIISQKVVLLK